MKPIFTRTLLIALLSAILLGSCENCDQAYTSLKNFELSVMNGAETIDSISFRGAGHKSYPKRTVADVSINPGDTHCVIDVYMNGDARYIDFKYHKKITFDCDRFFYTYTIDTVTHNFTELYYRKDQEDLFNSTTVITIRK